MKRRIYQFQLRLGVHRIKPAALQAPPPDVAALRYIIRDVPQLPLDFSERQPDVVYQLNPRPERKTAA